MDLQFVRDNMKLKYHQGKVQMQNLIFVDYIFVKLVDYEKYVMRSIENMISIVN